VHSGARTGPTCRLVDFRPPRRTRKARAPRKSPTRLREEAEQYERLPEDQRTAGDTPLDTHGLVRDDECSLDGIGRAAERVRKNEWWLLNRDLAPQIEFQYQKLMRSYTVSE
jgi:hypothetical protein